MSKNPMRRGCIFIPIVLFIVAAPFVSTHAASRPLPAPPVIGPQEIPVIIGRFAANFPSLVSQLVSLGWATIRGVFDDINIWTARITGFSVFAAFFEIKSAAVSIYSGAAGVVIEAWQNGVHIIRQIFSFL